MKMNGQVQACEPPSLDRAATVELRRCRDVHRYIPREYAELSLTANVAELETTSLVPGEFIPLESADPALTAFAQLVTLRLDVSCCLISLIDDRYQYIIAESAHKLSAQADLGNNSGVSSWPRCAIIPRQRTLDGHILETFLRKDVSNNGDVPIVIPDLPHYNSFPLAVTASDYAKWDFYAGMVIRSKSGKIIGVISVLDNASGRQDFDAVACTVLKDMARTTVDLLFARIAHNERTRAEKMIGGLEQFLAQPPETILSGNHTPRRDSSDLKGAGLASNTRTIRSRQNPEPQRSMSSRPLARSIQRTASNPNLNNDASTQLEDRGRTLNVTNISTPMSVTNSDAEIRFPRNQSMDANTTQLQKNILPPKTEAMFAHAAEVLRKASELDGVIFYDASVVAHGSHHTEKPGQDAAESSDPKRNSSRTTSSNSSDSSLGTSTKTRMDNRTCHILGSALSENFGASIDATDSNMPEKILRRILRFYTQGKIFSFGLTGDFATSSSDEASKITERSAQQRSKPSSQSVSNALKKIAPLARTLCVLPIWDHERTRWFTCFVAWSNNPQRAISPGIDLPYFNAFGNSVMNELARLGEASSSQMKTTFLASISHELRSPLHGILGGVEFMKNTELDAFQSGMLLSIGTCGNTLLDVIDHVLDVTQMNQLKKTETPPLQIIDGTTIYMPSRKKNSFIPDQGNYTMVSNLSVSTEEAVESIFASFSYRIRQRMVGDHDLHHENESRQQITITSGHTSDFDRKRVLIILDVPLEAEGAFDLPVGAWRRIIMNLVGNAVKYTESGYIKVKLAVGNTGKRADSRSSRITITISDSGIGMTPDYLVNRAFTAFSQEDSFSAGVGLGLHLVHQLTESLNGSIKVRTAPGKGTEFKISFDVPQKIRKLEVGPDHEHGMVGIKQQLAGKLVCILRTHTKDSSHHDRDKTQFEALQLFEDAICRTFEVWFGVKPTVIDAWEAQAVDIVFMLEASFELLRTIRDSISPHQSPPLILMLAMDAIEADTLRTDIRMAATKGIMEVITQPCGPLKLASVIQRCFARQEAGRSTNSPVGNQPIATELQIPETLPWSESSIPPSVKQSTDNPSTAVTLITDDNPLNRRLLVALMKKQGTSYIEAKDGLEAFHLYKEYHPEIACIFMDISMPVMDGMTSTREIRKFEQQNKLPRTVIIALTGLVSASARLEALSSGIDEFLTKPVNFNKLTELVASLIPDILDEADSHEKRISSKSRIVGNLSAPDLCRRKTSDA